ncbi:OprD family porin [Pseudomonas sp. dw_358]|uniref:OprD family porin n=1 Tax=Pseudomonas sp. dw_358 TaxID=2720083 RepID=UPI001BD6508B|nr:OprD family porin [Pseudomonas sp. dw_358]
MGWVWVAGAAVSSGVAHADFIEDSTANLDLRNVYFNRDFRQSGSRNKADEWAQGFMLRLQSGYTAGTVGFGLDALALVGYKLDGGDGTAGTGLLPADLSSGGSQREYGQLGLTAKIKISKTELKLGELMFRDPVISYTDTRLLPQTFSGGLLTSNELSNLHLIGGHIDQIKAVNSTDFIDLSANRIGGVSNSFNFGGGDYQVTPHLNLSARYAVLEDIYQQYYAGLIHVLPMGQGQSLKTDLRFANSREDGDFRNIDNRALGAMFTYKLGGHSFAGALQRMSGSDPFPYLANSDPYLVNFVQINDFGNIHEHSWQGRYDYDFAALGVPGLTFMARYVSGDNVERTGGGEGKEWERDTDLGYVIQSGPLKNVGVKWRNATVRSNFGNSLDENRLILSYTLALW